jgi:hypothetical protein
MTMDHAGENLILALGVEDREAYFCTIGVEAIRKMLEPLP